MFVLTKHRVNLLIVNNCKILYMCLYPFCFLFALKILYIFVTLLFLCQLFA